MRREASERGNGDDAVGKTGKRLPHADRVGGFRGVVRGMFRGVFRGVRGVSFGDSWGVSWLFVG